jgi:hypothetical protein
MAKQKLSDLFNFVARSKALQDYTVTLTRPDADLVAQAGDFRERLMNWLRLQGDDFKGNAEAPIVAKDGKVSLRCTEDTVARIERQFAGDILRVDPPARHARGAVYPPKVDPWDISKW